MHTVLPSLSQQLGLCWNQTKQFLWSETGPLAGYLDLLLSLLLAAFVDARPASPILIFYSAFLADCFFLAHLVLNAM
jgi:hypothetical protein